MLTTPAPLLSLYTSHTPLPAAHLRTHAELIDDTPPPPDRPWPIYDTPPIPGFNVREISGEKKADQEEEEEEDKN